MDTWALNNGYSIRLSEKDNGLVLPICEDVFKAVGLSELCTKNGIVKFYNLIEEDPEAAVKYVSYVCDLRGDLVRERLKRYFLIDLGIRLSKTQDLFLKRDEFIITSSSIGCLCDTWFSKSEILDMLQAEGFKLTINNI